MVRFMQSLQLFFEKDGLRLLTLTGLGGVGKTTLAIHFSSSLLDKYPDGVFFINLAPLTQSEKIILEIAHTLKIKQDAQKSTVENLEEHLSTKKLLLILDNFEHVMDGASQVNDLLQSLPNLQMIITSREPLRLRIEQVYPVRPLSSNNAVELFIQRALAVKPDFNASEKESRAIKKLCQRLDGLPLAVELAALRTKLFTPQMLLDRLKPDIEPATRMLDLFSSGTRDLPERQQSLRKMIAWSYSLLDSSEQRALRYASVFPSTFSVETLSTLMNIDEAQAIDLISSLVDKSLIKPSFEHVDDTRFFILESIREFSWNELRDAKELPTIKEAYVDLYLQLSKSAEEGLQGQRQIKWLKTIDTEALNLALAMEIGLAASVDSVLWLNGFWILARLEQYWMLHAYFYEIRELSQRALGHIEKSALSDQDFIKLKANIYSIVGTCSWLATNAELAYKYHQNSLELYKKTGDERKIAFALNNLAVSAHELGKHENGLDLYQQSLEIYENLQDKWGMARSHINLSNSHLYLNGDLDLGIYHTEAGLKFAEEINDPFLVAVASFNHADMLFRRGEKLQLARNLNLQAMQASRECQFLQILVWVLGIQAIFEIQAKNMPQALSYMHEGVSLAISQADNGALLGYIQLAAGISWENKKYAQTAFFLGAAEKLQNSLGMFYNIPDWDRFDIDELSLRTRLGKTAYQRAWTKGQEQTLDEVSASVLKICQPVQLKSLNFGLLTSRERDVLLLLAHGKSNDEIATKLVVVKKTVEKHVSKVLGKLGVKNRTEAAAWALARGLVEHDTED